MADRYWVGGGANNNWVTAGNWSATSGGAGGATVPTVADAVIFNGVGANANGTSTISLNITILSLTFTAGFTGSMVHTGNLTVSGSVTLHNNYSISGAGNITVNAASTLTSNGRTWPNPLVLTVASTTKTLADNWTVGALQLTNGFTVNGNTIFVNGSLTLSGGGTFSGTTTLNLQGSGSWIGSNPLSLTTTISGSYSLASGTVTFGGAVNNPILTITGILATAGSLLQIASSCTINSGTVIWNNVTMTAFSAMTLSSPLRGNILTIAAAINAQFIGGNRWDFNQFIGLAAGTIQTYNLQAGVDYQVWEALTINQGRTGAAVTIASNSGTVKAKLFLAPEATCNTNANFTRIDASIEATGYGIFSRTINTWNGVVTDCFNVNSFTDYEMVGLTF